MVEVEEAMVKEKATLRKVDVEVAETQVEAVVAEAETIKVLRVEVTEAAEVLAAGVIEREKALVKVEVDTPVTATLPLSSTQHWNVIYQTDQSFVFRHQQYESILSTSRGKCQFERLVCEAEPGASIVLDSTRARLVPLLRLMSTLVKPRYLEQTTKVRCAEGLGCLNASLKNEYTSSRGGHILHPQGSLVGQRMEELRLQVRHKAETQILLPKVSHRRVTHILKSTTPRTTYTDLFQVAKSHGQSQLRAGLTEGHPYV
ncbi:hypothetical protein BC629DRAFT_1444327 [Irpex lacteus]|nr:hypothetical protein BC629DRAFT_1444327 [Irpex lacteus]